MARETTPIKPTARTERKGDRLSMLVVCVATCTVILVGFTLWALRHILTPIALAVFLLFLVDRLARALSRRIRGLPPGPAARCVDIDRRREARLVCERIRLGVESYIWVQTVVGVIISGLSAILMVATGLPHVAFWTFIIFLANSIPAIGAAIGVLFPTIFG